MRKDCALNHLISDQELKVVLMRRKGATFAKIGEELGFCYQRIQQINQSGLESLRIENDIRKRNKALLRAADDLDIHPTQLKRLYRLLKRHGLLYDWRFMSESELTNIRGIGSKYAKFLIYAKENYLL